MGPRTILIGYRRGIDPTIDPTNQSERQAPLSLGHFGEYEERIEEATRSWRERDGTARLWAADASLFSDDDEAAWLGWLETASHSQERLPQWRAWSRALREDDIRDVVVLGMGGSSLCPEVLAQTLTAPPGSPRLRVLDSTVPAQVRSLQAELDLARTLFVVSSKSGTTIEANVLLEHFFAASQAALGSARAAARHFVAITDRDTPLAELAAERDFRHTEYGVESIGGRFSALSPFGMLPATLAGLDVEALLARARRMEQACRPQTGDDANPGVRLGIALAVLARAGRDKLTLVTSPALAAIGTWLEQLVAESTGKGGLGIVPIAGESLAAADAADSAGNDRVFVQTRLLCEPCAEQDAVVAALERAGHPTIRLEVQEPLDLAAEFYRWEFAIAVAGSLLGLNPFNQPDVEAAKVAARELTDGFVATGALPDDLPQAVQQGVALYSDPAFAIEPAHDLVATLAAHLARIAPHDYFALNAFVAMSERNQASLQRIREAVRRQRRTATTLGFGPRFLHSTGQLHKGGPDTGVFLQITADDDEIDVQIPGRDFSFGVLKQAQALGDFQVLRERGRRVLRLHLSSDVEEQLERIADIVERINEETK